jgi:hypothetical protein
MEKLGKARRTSLLREGDSRSPRRHWYPSFWILLFQNLRNGNTKGLSIVAVIKSEGWLGELISYVAQRHNPLQEDLNLYKFAVRMTRGWNGDEEQSGSSSIFRSGKPLVDDLKVYDAFVERVTTWKEEPQGSSSTVDYYDKWLGNTTHRRRSDTVGDTPGLGTYSVLRQVPRDSY